MLSTIIILNVIVILLMTFVGLVISDRDDRLVYAIAFGGLTLQVSLLGWFIYVVMHFVLMFW